MKKIYMIAGKARHGKDTLANYIKEYNERKNIKTIILQISTPLKYYAQKVLNWDYSEDSKPREFLQHIGANVIREKMGQDFLTKRLIDDIKILFNYCDCIIVSDVRMPIEFELVNEEFNFVKKIFIERTNFETNLTKDEQKHITEVALSNYDNYDLKILNDGSLLDLKIKIEKILEEDVL